MKKELPVREIVIETSMLVFNPIGYKSSLFRFGNEEIAKYLKQEPRLPCLAKEMQSLSAPLRSIDPDSLWVEMMALGIQSLSFETGTQTSGQSIKSSCHTK